MIARKIHIANKKNRNTFVLFKGNKPTEEFQRVDTQKNPVNNKKIIKGIADNSLEGLMLSYGDDLEIIAEKLIEGDPEVDYEITGKFISSLPRVYVNEDLQVVYKVVKSEKVYDAEGALKEERELKNLMANVALDDPLKWSNKLFPLDKVYNKFVFVRTYQLYHDSGLTYDFLFEIAKELHDTQSLLLMGSGNKGIGPVIFQQGGQSFRVFLEGRVLGDKYQLLMHLSNLELKSIHND